MSRDKLKVYVSLRQELLQEKNNLEQRLSEINAALNSDGPSQSAAKPARKARTGGTRRGKITTAEAVLKALEGGEAQTVQEISEGAIRLKGKVSKPSISLALANLKKAGKIARTGRGQYALKK